MFPSPVEGESVYRRCGIPVFPHPSWCISEVEKKCLRVSFERIRRFHGGKIFVTKRTANNRRIVQLYKAFPSGRFIHVIRDGRAVASSLLRVHWWRKHNLWWWNCKTPLDWEAEGREPAELAALNWVEEVKEIKAGLSVVPSDRIYEVRYEDLPLKLETILQKMVHFIELECKYGYIDDVKSLLIRNMNYRWRQNLAAKDQEIVIRIQSKLLRKLGYIL